MENYYLVANLFMISAIVWVVFDFLILPLLFPSHWQPLGWLGLVPDDGMDGLYQPKT